MPGGWKRSAHYNPWADLPAARSSAASPAADVFRPVPFLRPSVPPSRDRRSLSQSALVGVGGVPSRAGGGSEGTWLREPNRTDRKLLRTRRTRQQKIVMKSESATKSCVRPVTQVVVAASPRREYRSRKRAWKALFAARHRGIDSAVDDKEMTKKQ